MPGLKLTSSEAVFSAIAEFDSLGREEFLSRYGFRPARQYFLLYEGKRYDSKAVCGVAHGIENPDLGPLGASKFSGGERTVARILTSLGFTVVRTGGFVATDRCPIVLVQNEATYAGRFDHWQDETGVRYQYPNGYKNKIRPGRPFVYYRGVRRKDNTRGTAEYFGTGVIGEVWRDPSVTETMPKRRWKWFCAIDQYVPFVAAVPAKKEDGYYEVIGNPRDWGTAVREIAPASYAEILAKAGIQPAELGVPISPVDVQPHLPPIAEVSPMTLDNLGQAVLKRSGKPGSQRSSGGGCTSRHAKLTGDRAEEVVYRWLRCNLPADIADSVDWLAQKGETPGWDIQYTGADCQLVAVEVKGTSQSQFGAIEITGNEWEAAERLRDCYWLYLVTRCLSKEPRIHKLQNPFSRCAQGELAISPTGWRIVLSD